MDAGAEVITAATRSGLLWCSSRAVSRFFLVVPGDGMPRATSMRRSSSEVVSARSRVSGASSPSGEFHACRNGAAMRSSPSPSGQTSARSASASKAAPSP